MNDRFAFFPKILDLFCGSSFTSSFPQEMEGSIFKEISKIFSLSGIYWFGLKDKEGESSYTFKLYWEDEGFSLSNLHKLPIYFSSPNSFFGRVSDIEDKDLREYLKKHGVTSLLFASLKIDNKVRGFLLGVSREEEVSFDKDDFLIFRIISYMVYEFLRKSEVTEDMKTLLLYLKTMLNSLPDIIIIKDENEKWIFANIAALNFYGLRGIDYKGKTNLELIDYLKNEYMKHIFRNAMKNDALIRKNGAPIRYKSVYDGPNGKIYFDVRKIPIYDDNQTFRGILSIAKDITEDEKLKKRIEQRDRLESLGLMAGSIAHDFNNLLTVIMGNASMLERKAPKEFQRYIKNIINASSKASALTNQMLSYVGNRSIKEEVFDIGREIKNMKELLRSRVSQNVNIEIFTMDEDLYIKGSKGQIQQIVMNLVANASDAMKDRGGKIEIKVYKEKLDKEMLSSLSDFSSIKEGEYVVIDVKDNGPGIPDDIREHIFEPFFTTKEEGRGLGLFSVFGIVKSYKGAIRLCETGENGTRFKVYLPFSEDIHKEPKMQKKEEKKDIYRILIVDDEEYVLDILSQMLSFFGHIPITLSSSREALDFLSKDKNVDIIILDYSMPEMSGVELFRKIKEIMPDVKIVFSSGYAKEDLVDVLEEEKLDFLHKPYTIQKVKELLDKIDL